MGTHCSSELRRGHRNITMKLLLLTVFAAVALAEEVAEVEEVAKSAVVPLGYYPHASPEISKWKISTMAKPKSNTSAKDQLRPNLIMDFCPMVMGSHFIMVCLKWSFLNSLCLFSVLELMMT